MTYHGETRGQHISTLDTTHVGFTTVSPGGLTVEKRIMLNSNCDANEYAGESVNKASRITAAIRKNIILISSKNMTLNMNNQATLSIVIIKFLKQDLPKKSLSDKDM